MYLPPSISFPSFFMNFTSVKMLFGFLFQFCSLFFSFFPHRTSNHFLCSIFGIMFTLFSSDRFLHMFLYATIFCCIASFTYSFHHHVSPWFFLPFFPHISSQACIILFLKVFHRLGASTSTNSLTLEILFSFNFQTLLLIVYSLFTTFLNFLLSMSVTTRRCCNSQGMAFTSFKCFLLFLLTNTKSISVSFPPILYVIFLCSFLNHAFATHNSFSSQN